MPDLLLEQSIKGRVCGLDEVGRGPLAGPVVAACVFIPFEVQGLGFWSEVRDSKVLSEKKLSTLYEAITVHCVWSVAEIEPKVIDQINILQASLLAMGQAYEKIGQDFDHALVDGNKLPDLPCPATAVIKGDSKSLSIAAASIVAKVTRDRIMEELHLEYPLYAWDRNAGYPTPEHVEGLRMYGPCRHHRFSFGPVRVAAESRLRASS